MSISGLNMQPEEALSVFAIKNTLKCRVQCERTVEGKTEGKRDQLRSID